jgi:hypothetical protein
MTSKKKTMGKKDSTSSKRKASTVVAGSSQATKQACVTDTGATSISAAASNRSSPRASVAMEEEDATAHGDDATIEIIDLDGSVHSKSSGESESEASDAKLGF